MFKKVVWATDGSDGADQALSLAKELAAQGGGEVIAVHCEELMLAGKGGGPFPRYPNEDELQAKIERQVAEISASGVPASLSMATTPMGGVASAVADAAREREADLIVAGTRGHTVLGGLLVGSVTQRLLHLAPCPVLVVRTSDGHDGD